ncbi:hypothetical protein ACLKA6_003600 [Drosophila palustris]
MLPSAIPSSLPAVATPVAPVLQLPLLLMMSPRLQGAQTLYVQLEQMPLSSLHLVPSNPEPETRMRRLQAD